MMGVFWVPNGITSVMMGRRERRAVLWRGRRWVLFGVGMGVMFRLPITRK